MRDEESILTIDDYGKKVWRNKSGRLHRLDGPAIEYMNGDKFWYKNGELHRLDGPAASYKEGSKEWYQNGELHRLDGPAVEYSDGTKYWYQNGEAHRIDGPAINDLNGNKFWYYRDYHFGTKEEFFDALTDEEKVIALFSEDFHNG